MTARNCDAAVIGGGLVGAAIAWGLVRRGLSVTLLDEGDVALRAPRGNFGLVWVQGKRDGRWQHADWSRRSADLWPGFHHELLNATGIDVEYGKPGGLVFSMSEAGHEEQHLMLEQMHREVPGGYDFRMIARAELRQMIPGIGDSVFGASWCPHDGHANPLLLLRALHPA